MAEWPLADPPPMSDEEMQWYEEYPYDPEDPEYGRQFQSKNAVIFNRNRWSISSE